jgi:hypothetical protein
MQQATYAAAILALRRFCLSRVKRKTKKGTHGTSEITAQYARSSALLTPLMTPYWRYCRWLIMPHHIKRDTHHPYHQNLQEEHDIRIYNKLREMINKTSNLNRSGKLTMTVLRREVSFPLPQSIDFKLNHSCEILLGEQKAMLPKIDI